MKSKNYLEKINPKLRFYSGLAAILLLLMGASSVWLIVCYVSYLLLAAIFSYKIWLRSIIILSITILFFHLLLPTGKIIFSLDMPFINRTFNITSGALERGLEKLLLLLNLLIISGLSISRNLRLPGLLGAYFQQVFVYYDEMMQKYNLFQPLKPLLSLDLILLSSEKALLERVDQNDPQDRIEYARVLNIIFPFCLLAPMILVQILAWKQPYFFADLFS